ncbi:nucleotide sugar dehydrogenase [Planococcus sp. FY231025]|uniref:nucleotide sugar dehydrogenase n=1 Tax=Planococcus sp. FY231025 TaxID=3455699 RepID=UPI003F8E503D
MLKEKNNFYKDVKVSVIGLGYVGLPLAVELAKKYDVVGFDTNQSKLDQYLSGRDVTDEVGDEALKNSTVIFTSQEDMLKNCNFHIIAVPTPINSDKTPNLDPVIGASKIVGRNLQKNSIVVYESTVYPGTTEEICLPILEEESNLVFGKDFTIGYSPERINPGDKVHRLTNIVKIVSGSDEVTLEKVASLYESIIEAGVHRAPSIKVAEAAKVIENSQRDINIAFMNELSMVFNKMDIETGAVLEAANTKWNFLNFTPGLVGGHCIGVDPYYFVYKAEQLGYHSQIILAGRKINDNMGKYVAENLIKKLIKSGNPIKGAKVAILGIAFKENCGDVRNSKIIDIINELKEYNVEVVVHDPLVSASEVNREYNLNIVSKEELRQVDAVVLAVPHKEFIENYSINDFNGFYNGKEKIIIDVKGVLNKSEYQKENYVHWSL